MMKRIAAALATAAITGALGAATAQASETGEHATGAVSTISTISTVKSEDPPAGYTYEGSFYWHASCEEAGKGGIPRAWSAYVCLGDGMPWDEYALYVKYN